MSIYRDSTRLQLCAKCDSSAGKAGEFFTAKKNDRNEWIMTDARGKNWLLLDGILRNAFDVIAQNGTAPENRRNSRNEARLYKILATKGWPHDEAAPIVDHIFRDYNPEGLSIDAMAAAIIPYEYAIHRRG